MGQQREVTYEVWTVGPKADSRHYCVKSVGNLADAKQYAEEVRRDFSYIEWPARVYVMRVTQQRVEVDA